MDEITAAIVAAAALAIKKVGSTSIVDAYNALKNLIKRKYGEKSDVADAVEKVEAKPDSEGRQKMLAEEVASAGADRDPEVVEAARKVKTEMEAVPEAKTVYQNITLGKRAAFVGRDAGNIVTGDNSSVQE